MDRIDDYGKSGHRALRKGRRSLPGYSYLVTFTTFQRIAFFEDPIHAASLCRSLHRLEVWNYNLLSAWVLMPDHLHLLLTLRPRQSLSPVVQKTKANTSRALRSQLPGTTRVWAPAFHDRLIGRNETMKNIARYIVLNPVRAGLADRVGNYPYWNALWL